MTDDAIETALSRHVGQDAAAAFIAKVARYWNLPAVIDGIAKIPANPELEAAALAIVDDDCLASALGLDPPEPVTTGPAFARHGSGLRMAPTFALLTLAARADVAAVDRVDGRFTRMETAAVKLAARIRRRASRFLAGTQDHNVPRTTHVVHPDAPQRLSEVKAWLQTHDSSDLAMLVVHAPLWCRSVA